MGRLDHRHDRRGLKRRDRVFGQRQAKSEPGVGEKIIAAVGTAAAAALTKKMIERAWSGGPVFSRE